MSESLASEQTRHATANVEVMVNDERIVVSRLTADDGESVFYAASTEVAPTPDWFRLMAEYVPADFHLDCAQENYEENFWMFVFAESA